MMKNKLENSYLDCISFNSTKTRYYVGENIFSSNKGIRFWVDYERPIEFTASSTGNADDLKNLNIKCEQVEASINDITDKEIIIAISNYKILKVYAYRVSDTGYAAPCMAHTSRVVHEMSEHVNTP